MKVFAGAISTLDEYSILMQVPSTLSISFKLQQSCHFHSCTSERGQMLQVFFKQKKEIASSFSAINVLNMNKTIILLNLAEYHLILAHSAYDLVG